MEFKKRAQHRTLRAQGFYGICARAIVAVQYRPPGKDYSEEIFCIRNRQIRKKGCV